MDQQKKSISIEKTRRCRLSLLRDFPTVYISHNLLSLLLTFILFIRIYMTSNSKKPTTRISRNNFFLPLSIIVHSHVFAFLSRSLFSPLLDPWRTCPANFSNRYIYICSRLIEFFSFFLSFFPLSLSLLHSNEKKTRTTRAYSPIARRTEQSFFFFFLFLLRTKQEIITYSDVVEKEERLEKRRKRPFVYIHYHAITQNTEFFFLLFLSKVLHV